MRISQPHDSYSSISCLGQGSGIKAGPPTDISYFFESKYARRGIFGRDIQCSCSGQGSYRAGTQDSGM